MVAPFGCIRRGRFPHPENSDLNPMSSPALPSRKFACKPDFDECLARIYAWYEQRIIDRPPVRFHHHNIEYERKRTIPGAWTSARQRWLDAEFQVKTFVDSLAGTEFLGETFPLFWPNLAAVVYNLLLGQPAEFDDVTVWTHPWVDDLDHPPPLGVQWEGEYFRAVEALMDRALDAGAGRFLVGYTDIYGGIDCTAGVRGTERMCMDLVTNPQGILRLIDGVFHDYPALYAHFDRQLKARDQLSVTWMALPSFGTFNVLACDFAVNISRQHFDEFCMPVTRREAELFTHNVFHMDGPGVAKNLDSILTLPNLAAIQWAQGIGKNLPILQWIPLIKKIQAAGKSVIVDLQPAELDDFLRQVDPRGIMLWVSAEPKDQRDVLERVKRW
jgi:hypothetical protein